MLENDKLTEEEIRLTELAEKILQEAVNQAEEPKAEKSFMKLQHIVNQLVSQLITKASCIPVVKFPQREFEMILSKRLSYQTKGSNPWHLRCKILLQFLRIKKWKRKVRTLL